MKIRILAGVAGTDFVLNRGEVTERYSIAEARRLIEAGLAEPVAEEHADPSAIELAKVKNDVAALNKQIAERDAQLLDAARLQTENDDLRKRVADLEAERAAAASPQPSRKKKSTPAAGAGG